MKTVRRMRSFQDTPMRIALSGWTPSSTRMPSGSAKDVTASWKEMPCFFRFVRAFVGSQT